MAVPLSLKNKQSPVPNAHIWILKDRNMTDTNKPSSVSTLVCSCRESCGSKRPHHRAQQKIVLKEKSQAYFLPENRPFPKHQAARSGKARCPVHAAWSGPQPGTSQVGLDSLSSCPRPTTDSSQLFPPSWSLPHSPRVRGTLWESELASGWGARQVGSGETGGSLCPLCSFDFCTMSKYFLMLKL